MRRNGFLHRRSAFFLDRDGVINRTYMRGGKPRPPDSLSQFELLPGVVETLERLEHAGFLLVVVTNQPDVARGSQSRERVERINDHIRDMLPVHDIITCFHDDWDDCTCRKPRPGMLLEAARRLPIALRRSFLVGDRWSDVVAGQTAGCQAILIDKAYSQRERCRPDSCVADLSEAVEWALMCADYREGVAA